MPGWSDFLAAAELEPGGPMAMNPDLENDALRARIAELERANAELSRNAERWRECERLAEARGITSHEWVMLFKVDTGTLEGNIDASISARKGDS